MRILHAPENIGGMAGVLGQVQSRLGHEAVSYSFTSNHFKFSSDIILRKPGSFFERLYNALSFTVKFDVFQFYFGSSLMDLKDVHWLSILGKKIYFYFCGCDIRDEKTTIMKYPISACANCFPKLCSANRQLARKMAEKYGKVNFVSTPDLLEFVERSVLLPQVVDFDLINEIIKEPLPERNPEKFVIAHAPTNRLIKGTQYLIDCVKRLQNKGFDIDLLLIENMSHAEALRMYRCADLAVDQLLVGSYGLLSAELMALGVPTITYIREDLVDKYPKRPPLINANPFNLEDTIAYLYKNREELTTCQDAGLAYAYEIHHPVRLAIKCLEYYEQ
ncbi:glycosyltransferase [Pelotomaculum propionicicum]|uniref:glycosyltransferase n=1 Tax=Pelotomaculum propionicicum TaxID=258475 RepID=UPI003B80CD5B